jgi:hypothetical protein
MMNQDQQRGRSPDPSSPIGEMLNESQQRSLGTVLRRLEQAAWQMEVMLRQENPPPLMLTRFVHPPTASQRAALLTIATAIRAEVARLASDVGITPHVEDQTNALQALFSLQWADLEDAQPQKLRRYGQLHPRLHEALGPRIQRLASYSIAIADMLSEARAPDDILRLLNLFSLEEEERGE